MRLPFFLLHRTGFTREFINCVTSLVQEGLPIQAIVRHIQRIREQSAVDTVLNMINDYTVCTGVELTNVQIKSLVTSNTNSLIEPIPTNDLIGRCFIIHFQENEDFYVRHHIRHPSEILPAHRPYVQSSM